MRIEDDSDGNDNGFSVVSDDDEHDDKNNKDKESEYEAEGDALALPRASHTAPNLRGIRFAFARGERR